MIIAIGHAEPPGAEHPRPANLRMRPVAHRRHAPVCVAVTRVAVLTLGAVALAAVHLHRPTTVCPLRAFTGVPCPLCGGTTAAVRLGSGDLLGALRAAPVVVLAAVAFVTAPLGVAARWWRLPAPRRVVLTVLALSLAEGWQLVRLGVGDG